MNPVLPLLFVLSAHAEEVPSAQAQAQVQKIETHYSSIKTLQASFTQTVKNPIYGDQTQAGTVVFGRPGKMAWTFGEDGTRYVSDGSTLWLVREADKQAFKYGGYDPSGSAESLLHSLDNLTLLYDVSVDAHSAEKGTRLTLKPKAEGTSVVVHITFLPDLVVSQVVVTDEMGTRTEMAFSDMKTNVEVPESTFAYTPGPGVEVIDAGAPP